MQILISLLVIAIIVGGFSFLRAFFRAIARRREQRRYITLMRRQMDALQHSILSQGDNSLEENNQGITHMVFISYSRKQFCYAESLTLCLEYYGVSTWFDVQKIPSGADWEQSIQTGLDSCTALLLVASRDSLSSWNVSKEWKAVLQAKKPVYVILFEAVELPPELGEVSVIDGRFLVKRKMRLFAEQLLPNNSWHRDRLFMASPRFFLTRMPLWAAGMLFFTWIASLISMVGLTIVAADELQKNVFIAAVIGPLHPTLLFDVLSILLPWLLIAGYVFAFPFLFFAHWRGLAYIGMFFVGSFLAAAYLFLEDFFTIGKLVSANIAGLLLGRYMPNEAIAIGITFFGLFIGIFPFRLMIRSRFGLWWLPTGSFPDKMRQTVNQNWLKFLPPQPLPREKNTTYQLHYVVEDSLIADSIRQEFHKYYTYTQLQLSTDDRADYHLVLLTHHTPIHWLERQLEWTGHTIFVVCTNIQTPQNIQQFHRFQWFDYRKRSSEQLRLLADRLSTGSATTQYYNFAVLPEQLEHPVVPEKVGLLSGNFRFMALLNVEMGFFSLLSIEHSLVYFVLCPASLYVGWYLSGLANQIDQAAMTRKQFINAAIFLFIDIAFYNAISFLLVPRISPANPGVGFLLTLDMAVFTGGIVLSMLILYLDRKIAYPVLHTWFSAGNKRLPVDSEGPTLALIKRWPWYRVVPYFLLALEIAFLFLANSS